MRIPPSFSTFTGNRGAVEPSLVRARWCWFWGMLVIVWLLGGVGGVWAQSDTSASKSAAWDKSKTKAKTRLMERYRAKLEVKDDAEWSIIQKRIENILSAEHALQAALAAAQHKSHSSKSSRRNASTTGGGERAPALEGEEDIRALQQSIADKAPAQEIKPRLARVRELLKARQESLASAREELRAVLSSRQEAIAVLSGLLR